MAEIGDRDTERGKLLLELGKIEQVERSDLRMLETARHRFRSKLKRFEVPQLSSGSDISGTVNMHAEAIKYGFKDQSTQITLNPQITPPLQTPIMRYKFLTQAVDVRMYDTHNPGFCYHCTGAIRASETSPRKRFADLFDVVHSMLFTNGEVDPDKVLCLHVLAAHYAKSSHNQMRPISPLIEKGRRSNFAGVWNSVLPCYVMDVEQTVDDGENFSDEMKRHKNPLVVEAEEEVARDLQCKYEKYLEENSDVCLAIYADHQRTSVAPNGIGKITIIPPHVYSLLGAAQELKIKQAIAEESRRKKFRRSNSSIKNVDDQSTSFRLEDEDDVVSRRLMTATSIRGWNGTRIVGTSKISGFRSPSRRSATSSHKTEPSITTLKRASPRSSEIPPLSEDLDARMGRIASRTSSTKSPFRNFSSLHGPGCPGSISIMSGISGLGEPRKIRRPIFINSPVTSRDLRYKEYKTVPILVNNQMQALVHSVLDVLGRVNPSKMRKIVSAANSPYEIRRMLIRPDIQLFIDSLAGQPLITSPHSFVVSVASILHEIDPRVENSIEKELVATTLEVPPAPALHRLVRKIRSNLFVDRGKTVGSKPEVKIETFRSQKQKLLGSNSNSCKTSAGKKEVFDVSSSCQHLDFQQTKMTCACCYAKWKDSLSDTERSKVPDFSFLVSHDSELILTLENSAKYETDNCQMEEKEPRDSHDSKTKKEPHGTTASTVKSLEQKNVDEGVIVHGVETDASNRMTSNPEPEIEASVSLTNPKAKNLANKEGFPKTKCKSPRTSKKSLARITSLSVYRKSRLIQKTSGYTLAEKSMTPRAELSTSKISIDQLDEARSRRESSTFGLSKTDCHGLRGTTPQKPCSKITLDDAVASPKCQFKPWKASRNPSYLEPDRVILRRMTNRQRILVGQMCASLKTKKTNREGLVKERTPLAALIAPVLSHETLRTLTKGMRQDISRKMKISPEKDNRGVVLSEELTGSVLVKVQQAVAENETNRRLSSFLKSRV